MNESALEGFVKIVELNSFSAAAEALYLSQSALSQQIRTLEGQLQFELFQHVPRRVVLTPAGQDFYPKEKPLSLDELTPFLQGCAEKEPEMYVALYADESVPYREIVRVLNIANENHFKMVLATRPPENK